jgi:VIT1/CCC1 family predicted Fe2+/Mn2+ transporter
MTSQDAVAMLATTTGTAVIVGVILNVARSLFTPEHFDRWAPAIAVVIGVVLSVSFAVVTVAPLTGVAILGAVLVGVLAGALSQNVNTVIQRTIHPPTS